MLSFPLSALHFQHYQPDLANQSSTKEAKLRVMNCKAMVSITHLIVKIVFINSSSPKSGDYYLAPTEDLIQVKPYNLYRSLLLRKMFPVVIYIT